MTVPHPLPDPLVDLIAERFRVIGEPVRIKLLDRLRDGRGVGRRADRGAGATQQNVSRHLAVLHAAGIVGRRKEGTRVVYAITDETMFALCETVCGSLQQSVAELAQLLDAAPSRRRHDHERRTQAHRRASLERVLFGLAGSVVLPVRCSRPSSARGSCCWSPSSVSTSGCT